MGLAMVVIWIVVALGGLALLWLGYYWLRTGTSPALVDRVYKTKLPEPPLAYRLFGAAFVLWGVGCLLAAIGFNVIRSEGLMLLVVLGVFVVGFLPMLAGLVVVGIALFSREGARAR